MTTALCPHCESHDLYHSSHQSSLKMPRCAMETRWFYIARHAVLKKLLWGVGGMISGPHSGGIINPTHAGIAIPFSRHHHREANYKLQGQMDR